MVSPRPRVRLAVAGCGHIMQSIYGPILRTLEDRVQIVGLCDLNPGAAAAVSNQFRDASVYPDIASLLKADSADSVLVLTSESANARVAEQVLEAGLPVYLEKPPVATVREFERLSKVESTSRAGVFVAFNRRHTPLFRDLGLPPFPIRSIHGRLSRRGRPTPSFPYTAIHLIDSVSFFTRQRFSHAEIVFKTGSETSLWSLQGRLEHGAFCELEFVPDGSDHSEFMIIEGDGHQWELQFPNPEGRFPEGKLDRRDALDHADTIFSESVDPLENMGYAPCLRLFIEGLSNSFNGLPHHLRTAHQTIMIMEAMMRRQPSTLELISHAC